ncbi:MAG: tRNA pseudouridine(55) synthase TruB [Lachnospiraceae bacterium]|nr:tRNA pseudouridine(55) synthase TruB [Lachnospiraceae bacterium]
MKHGIINVYKEKGFTSHDVVAKLRGICKQKKIGHTGTLDPDAVGVLPVCLGSATKLCDMLTEKEKEYIAEFELGMVTDTQDISGKVLTESKVEATEEQVREVILSFVGDYDQTPPMYSALKVNGKKLYELAREGKEIERKSRPVRILEIEILEEKMPKFCIRVRCSKGTYIRTLCHDIGQKLGCGAVMTSLKRTQSGRFGIDRAYPLSEIQKMADEGRLDELVIPVEEMFTHLNAVVAGENAQKALANGNQLKREEYKTEKELTNEEQVRLYSAEGKFHGVYRYDKKRKLLCPVQLFFEQ